MPRSPKIRPPRLETIDLSAQLGPLRLANPVLVASGTFGALMDAVLDVDRLGGVVEKTVTMLPRKGNPHPRVWETAGGMLNSIGLDNHGLEGWIQKRYPRIRGYRCKLLISVSGRTTEEFAALVRRLDELPRVDAFELNISGPNVSRGMDFGVDPSKTEEVVRLCRAATQRPIFAKLTPNVADVAAVARAAMNGGADGVSLINTVRGMAVDWRRRAPCLGGVTGGLSGPAVKPIALRMVWEVARALPGTPIMGIGGIMNADDAMEFFVAGARAVQLGTANLVDAGSAIHILNALPEKLASIGATRLRDYVGTMEASDR
ncbi:MAG: dihydroorotate dehydrogenase [Planctomycetes bacterium]|nr:dihydroorotate dehydrogenase [Planctomycetota bacterium]